MICFIYTNLFHSYDFFIHMIFFIHINMFHSYTFFFNLKILINVTPKTNLNQTRWIPLPIWSLLWKNTRLHDDFTPASIKLCRPFSRLCSSRNRTLRQFCATHSIHFRAYHQYRRCSPNLWAAILFVHFQTFRIKRSNDWYNLNPIRHVNLPLRADMATDRCTNSEKCREWRWGWAATCRAARLRQKLDRQTTNEKHTLHQMKFFRKQLQEPIWYDSKE